MKDIIRIAAFIVALAIQAFGAGFQLNSTVLSGAFTSESAAADPDTVRSQDGKVAYIKNNNWVAYQNFDFGAVATYLWIEGATPNTGGAIEVRLAAVTGTLIGTVNIKNTGGCTSFQQFGTTVSPSICGVHDVYLKFVGGGGYLFDTQSLSFQRISPGSRVALTTTQLPIRHTTMNSSVAGRTLTATSKWIGTRRSWSRSPA